MNSVTIAGRIAALPHHEYRTFMHITEFDIDVPVDQHRKDRFRIATSNELAERCAGLAVGTTVLVPGTLRSEAHDMPDRQCRVQDRDHRLRG